MFISRNSHMLKTWLNPNLNHKIHYIGEPTTNMTRYEISYLVIFSIFRNNQKFLLSALVEECLDSLFENRYYLIEALLSLEVRRHLLPYDGVDRSIVVIPSRKAFYE